MMELGRNYMKKLKLQVELNTKAETFLVIVFGLIIPNFGNFYYFFFYLMYGRSYSEIMGFDDPYKDQWLLTEIANFSFIYGFIFGAVLLILLLLYIMGILRLFKRISIIVMIISILLYWILFIFSPIYYHIMID